MNASRQYAQPPRPFDKPGKAASRTISQTYDAQAALKAVQSQAKGDGVNPPLSTLPPPLILPERSEAQTVVVYWFRIGRAYGTFYKDGVKAVWYNNKAALMLRDRIKSQLGAGKEQEAALNGLITRSEWQILQRNDHDIGKLPVFGFMVLLFGEWLPLIVPFVPRVVPGTCRIPKQVQGMREAAEQRRSLSFRQGIEEPSKEILPIEDTAWPMANAPYVRSLLQTLRNDQLHHLSTSLGLHSRIWDRLQLPPPTFLIRHALTRRLQRLTFDDKLLSASTNASKLSLAELERACEERGLDILGRREALLRDHLSWWLERQKDDRGRGWAMLAMFFRRLAMREWLRLNVEANRSQA